MFLLKALCLIILVNIFLLGLTMVIAACWFIRKKIIAYKRNRRKEQYKKQYKPTTVQDDFSDLFPPVENPQYKRYKKKQLAKRRKGNKIARKSRQQNRK